MLNSDYNTTKSLKGGSDLNNLLTADKWFLSADKTYSNAPLSGVNMVLTTEVISSLTAQRVIQTLISYANKDRPVFFFRIIECAGFGLYPNQGTIYPKVWQQLISYDGSSVYADNASATTGGLLKGAIYRTSDGTLKIVY